MRELPREKDAGFSKAHTEQDLIRRCRNNPGAGKT
jgi:hypothetical protein